MDNTIKKNIDIINFQNNFKFLKNELFFLSNEIVFLKDVLINISTNLLYLNNIKIYENLKYGYVTLYNEIEKIKILLNELPDVTYIKQIKSNIIDIKNIIDITNMIYKSKKLLLKYINHIAPYNMSFLYNLLFGFNWKNNFKSNEIELLLLLDRIFIPICVWDSSLHSTPVNYIINETKRPTFNKETIDNVIEMKDDKVSSIIIGNTNTFPSFLKSISEIILKDKNEVKQERVKDFKYDDIFCQFTNNMNVIFTKNNNSNSFVEDKNGFNVLLRINERIIVIQGITRDDILELYKTNPLIKKKLNDIFTYITNDIVYIPIEFKLNYINSLNIRDILISTNEVIINTMKKKYNDYKILQSKTLGVLINDFLLASKFRKLEILTLFLSGNSHDCMIGFLLYDILKMKDKTNICTEIYNSLHIFHKMKIDNTEITMKNEEEKLVKMSTEDISYERRINLLNVDNNIKNKAIEKLKSLKNNFQGDNKAQTWLDGFLKIPFGIYRSNKLLNFKKNIIEKINSTNATNLFSHEEINNFIKNNYKIDDTMTHEWNEYKVQKLNYLNDIRKKLDSTVYGHKEAKIQLERLVAQWINGETKGAVIGLWGPPGTGKTSLAKNGLSQCMIDDDNIKRPFGFLPIGGSVNGSTLVGHNYTYVGATWGRIVDILISSQCMNPIIFIDEIDKISNTEYGKEIVSILTHLTDSTQNDSFEDKYYSGIPLDLSKALIVFSFNDINMLDPILKDRITIIETKAYTIMEKIHIIQEYMLPEILKDVGFSKNEIIFNEEIIKYLIGTFTNEAGVRKIKEKLVDIVRDINLSMMHSSDNYNIPFIVEKKYIDNLFKNKPKMHINKIHKNPEVGLVNGLYATSSGVGGLTVIQVMKYPSDKMMELKITGQQGEVMKESVEYAMKIAYSLLNQDEQNKILEDSRNKNNFGLLIHTPDAGTKKEGPSAGTAMTLAIYSVLSNKKVDNKIALTGEIDLWKNVKMIGGVSAKLNGAKIAGVKLALIPKENEDDLNILRDEGNSPEDESFVVKLIETIEDVISICII